MNTPYNTHHTRSGFTLIELLVVIAIMTILAAVILASMTVIRDRGRAAAILNEVASIRGALQFRYADVTQYPTEEELRIAYPGLPVGAISIADMIGEDVFNGKFAAAPTPKIGTNIYYYDADGTDGSTVYPIESCGSYTNNEYGVNVYIEDALVDHAGVAVQLDELVDSGDGLDCGRIRRPTAVSNVLLYNLAVTPTKFP